ncbi:MAG TPA: hypothetical protein VK147_11490 [Candidatus Didemnitutus sp.]|nr:hypothetical protein [Candidatus Didemnitutus sp.]
MMNNVGSLTLPESRQERVEDHLSYSHTPTSQRSTTTTTIDLNAVPSGIYRVVVTTPTQVESVGVVKR